MWISERPLFSWEKVNLVEKPIYHEFKTKHFISKDESTALVKLTYKQPHRFTVWEKTFIASIHKMVNSNKWRGATWKQYVRFNSLARKIYRSKA